jgi:uncharacterized protein (DUF2344 family)
MTKESITTNIQAKRPISQKEKNELLTKIVESDAIITDLVQELKDYTADKKGAIESERMNISRCCQLARDGFEQVTHECTVDYSDNITKFTDIHSGEIVEEHPTTEEEQLRLNGKWKDAEEVIREDSKENE